MRNRNYSKIMVKSERKLKSESYYFLRIFFIIIIIIIFLPLKLSIIKTKYCISYYN